MIRCKLCGRVTEKRETTGRFTTFIDTAPKGRRAVGSLIVCMNCNGEDNDEKNHN